MEDSKWKHIKQIQFFFHESDNQFELNLTSDLTISDIKLILNKKVYVTSTPKKELIVFSIEKQSILTNNMTLENIRNKDLFFVCKKANYNEDAIQIIKNLRMERKNKLERIVNLTTSQLKVASLLFNQGISIEKALYIAEPFHSDKIWIDEILEDNDIKVDDLLFDYHFLMGSVGYYDGGGEYRPIKKNQQEKVFYDFFKRFNYLEKRMELVGDNLVIIYCVYSEC